ncbi:helix-turn-helix transcriptional regulator, partial [Sphaerisporangium sp. B11E5]|uniref:helix-turn-helix domain-containing protein n=1 Tax=Sphaerisporangium sp. B11E5 TaxID=3153563 RepID=UPI00325E29ED
MTEPPAADDLATYLRHLKNKTGRSYDALAKRLGVSKSTLHRYCSGDSVPPRFTLLEQFAKECQANQAEIIELHQRWVRVQTAQPPAPELPPEHPTDPTSPIDLADTHPEPPAPPP